MIIAAGVFILYKGIRQLIVPVPVEKVDLGIWLVSITALVNFVMGRICIRIGTRNNSLALVASGRHLQSDTISTIGIVAGLILLYFTGETWIDGAVAIIFGLFIVITGYRIVRHSIAGIMDEVDEQLLSDMVEMLNANRRVNWIDLHNLRVIKYGSVLHVDCHLTVPWYLNVHEAHEEIDALSEQVRNKFGESVELFVHSDGCLPFQCPICDKEDCPVRQHPFERTVTWTLENISQNQKHQLPDT